MKLNKKLATLIMGFVMASTLTPTAALAYDNDINRINDKIITNTYKNWIIRFNSAVDTNYLSGVVQVKDITDGTVQQVTVLPSDDVNTIKINAPSQGYKLEHNYEILVDKSIRSRTGKNPNRKAVMNFTVMDLSKSNYSANINVVVSPIIPALKQIAINTTDLPQIKKFKIDGNDKVFAIDDKAVSAINASSATIYFYGSDGITVIGKGTLDVSQSRNNLSVKINNAE
ncbi:hypothetical protein [Clostridium sp. OS1-26]|uniref:hypothetical protein n=1 Tax=Clostridium sp. OS1-26 TaxID=3070681 RepID=UPI0027E1548B|nr:hypothetical protein [Clostridium sp. OS1-26]WML35449.1 hypothetical protein RCG18_01440 [Clostridium sp. OS1-26]